MILSSIIDTALIILCYWLLFGRNFEDIQKKLDQIDRKLGDIWTQIGDAKEEE